MGHCCRGEAARCLFKPDLEWKGRGVRMEGPEARQGQPSWRACEPGHGGQTKSGEKGEGGHCGIILAGFL